jgi:hypothetical protein
MAERRKTRSAGDVAEKRRSVAEKRRPVDDEGPEVLDEDEPEDFDEDGEPKVPDEEPEEREMLDDRETEASGGASLTASEAARSPSSRRSRPRASRPWNAPTTAGRSA